MFEVQASIWRVGRQVFRRGDRVPAERFGPQVDAYRRLGLIAEVKDKTKAELMAEAEAAGIEVPARAKKSEIAALLEGAA